MCLNVVGVMGRSQDESSPAANVSTRSGDTAPIGTAPNSGST